MSAVRLPRRLVVAAALTCVIVAPAVADPPQPAPSQPPPSQPTPSQAAPAKMAPPALAPAPALAPLPSDANSNDSGLPLETPSKPAEGAAPSQKAGDGAAAANTATLPPGQTVAILGKKVVGPDGKAVMGPVTDILVDSDGEPRAAVIDFGGFVGVGSRRVAIDWRALKIRPEDADAPLQLTLTPDEIKAAPEYKDPKAPTQIVKPPLQPEQPAAPSDAGQ